MIAPSAPTAKHPTKSPATARIQRLQPQTISEALSAMPQSEMNVQIRQNMAQKPETAAPSPSPVSCAAQKMATPSDGSSFSTYRLRQNPPVSKSQSLSPNENSSLLCRVSTLYIIDEIRGKVNGGCRKWEGVCRSSLTQQPFSNLSAFPRCQIAVKKAEPFPQFDLLLFVFVFRKLIPTRSLNRNLNQFELSFIARGISIISVVCQIWSI